MHAFSRSVFIYYTALLVVIGCGKSAQNQQATIFHENADPEPVKKLAGDTDVAPTGEVLNRGKVLISYSDCFICHKETDRKRGPAFQDIAARYPMNSTYIRVLAKRIILGARGSWGNAVMPPHPEISEADAETAVMYILSLDNAK